MKSLRSSSSSRRRRPSSAFRLSAALMPSPRCFDCQLPGSVWSLLTDSDRLGMHCSCSLWRWRPQPILIRRSGREPIVSVTTRLHTKHVHFVHETRSGRGSVTPNKTALIHPQRPRSYPPDDLFSGCKIMEMGAFPVHCCCCCCCCRHSPLVPTSRTKLPRLGPNVLLQAALLEASFMNCRTYRRASVFGHHLCVAHCVWLNQLAFVLGCFSSKLDDEGSPKKIPGTAQYSMSAGSSIRSVKTGACNELGRRSRFDYIKWQHCFGFQHPCYEGRYTIRTVRFPIRYRICDQASCRHDHNS
jgi:hypothetical protein